MPEITITSLVDNCVTHPGNGLLGEHGLAFLIQSEDKNLLFDTGNGYTILKNAKILGINWKELDSVVLSHAHDDHTGGLDEVLDQVDTVNVYVHPYIFKPKCVVMEGRPPEYNSLPKTREDYEKNGARFVIREENLLLCNGIELVGPIQRQRPSEDKRMPYRYIKEDDKYFHDTFNDEQVLAIHTPKGLVLVLGCTHNGLIDTVEQVCTLTKENRIFGIIGGLHLCNTPPENVRKLAVWLQQLGISILGCCHCTGLESTAILSTILGDKVFFNHVGRRTVIEI